LRAALGDDAAEAWGDDMRVNGLAIALAGAICLAWTADAMAADCSDPGSANVTDLSFSKDDATILKGLTVAIQLGLQPKSFPADDIEKNKAACRRGTFTARGETFQIFGDDKDSPPRWAIGADPKRIAYEVLLPDPAQAADWYDKYQRDPKTPADFSKRLYALVITDGDRRLIYQFSRVLPDNYHLAQNMRATLDGKWSPVAVLDAATGEVDLSNIGKAGVRPLTGEATPSPLMRMAQPDGVYFVSDPGGGVHHTPSGLVCPAEVAGYKRVDMSVFKPEDGGVDLLCRYFSAKSWFSVFETKIPDSSIDKVFADYLKDAQAQTPVAGALPPPADIPSVRSAFWTGHEGARQGMWVARKDDWYLEVRVTWSEGDEANVAAFTRAIFALEPKAAP
jgi:hypothetical protein